jgi:hypothetical protein
VKGPDGIVAVSVPEFYQVSRRISIRAAGMGFVMALPANDYNTMRKKLRRQ